MPDFTRGKIYIIKHRTKPEYTYIGSTCQELESRFSKHKSCARNGTSPVYTCMREKCIFAFYIELLEPYPCNRAEELLEREQFYKDLLKPTLNHNNPVRQITQSEYNSKFVTGEKVKCIYCDCEKSKNHMLRHKRICIKRCGIID